MVRSYLCAVFESDPAKVKSQLTIRRQGDTFEEDPNDVLPLIKRVLTQHILPAFAKWLQGIQWMTVSIPNFVFTNNNRGYGIRNNSSFRICSNPCFPSSLWRVSFPSRANWFLCSNRIRRSSTIPFNRFCIAGKKPQATIFRCEVSVDRSNESADLTKCFELRSESSRESVLCALFLRNASLLSMELRFVVVFMCRACNFSRTSFNPAHRSLPRCAFSR